MVYVLHVVHILAGQVLSEDDDVIVGEAHPGGSSLKHLKGKDFTRSGGRNRMP